MPPKRENGVVHKLFNKFLVPAILVVCLITIATVLIISPASVATPSGIWSDAVPELRKISDYPSDPITPEDNCQQSTLQVVHGFATAAEPHCTITTSYGDVDGSSQIFRPSGYQQAYKIDPVVGGNPVILPLAGRSDALGVTGTGTGSVYMGYYSDAYTHLKYDVAVNFALGTTYAHYTLNAPPDTYFLNSDKTPMQFDISHMASSANGRYTVADSVRNGVALIDMDTHVLRPVADDASTGPQGRIIASAVEDTGAYAAFVYSSPNGDSFKVVDLRSCSGNFNDVAAAPAFGCRVVDLYAYIKRVLPGLQFITHVQFTNDHDISLTVRYRDSNGTAKYALYNMVAAGYDESLIDYEALGDSYTSGEGAFSYREGTDTSFNRCHQSTVSYPYVLGKSFDSFASLACSGARLHNLLKVGRENDFQTYGSPSDKDYLTAESQRLPGYVLQAYFIAADNPQAITVSIGGNDIGFGDVLAKCVHPLKSLRDAVSSADTCYSTYEDRAELVGTINGQFTRLRDLYKKLLDSPSGKRRVYVIGYPQVAKVGGSCGANVQMNADEVKFSNDLIAYLDSVVERAANEAGAKYVDIQHALDGHLLCEATGKDLAMNGFTIDKSDSLGYNFTPSFHPTTLGQKLVGQWVASQTNNLTAAMPAPTTQTSAVVFNSDANILQNLPHTNRAVRIVRPVGNLLKNVVTGQVPLKVVLAGRDYLIKAKSQVDLVINSNPVTLGSATADDNGNVSFDTAIPTNVPPGIHTIHAYGVDVFGNSIDLRQTIYVTASENDYDADGVPNAADSCPLTAQSGIDTDGDGIDDACDFDNTASNIPLVDESSIHWYDNSVLEVSINARR